MAASLLGFDDGVLPLLSPPTAPEREPVASSRADEVPPSLARVSRVNMLARSCKASRSKTVSPAARTREGRARRSPSCRHDSRQRRAMELVQEVR